MPLKGLGSNQIIRKSENVGKLYYPFLRGQPIKIPRRILHAKQSEM